MVCRERGELDGDETLKEGKWGSVACVGGKISNCKFERALTGLLSAR